MRHVLNSLAVFRLTWLIMNDNLPFDIMATLRDAIGIRQNAYGHDYGTNEFAKLFTCQWCLSIYIGLLFAKGNIREALAYSGVTGLLFRIMQ